MAPTTIDAPSDAAEAEARAALENEADGFHDELAAAREAEGLDGATALPKAADDDGASLPAEPTVTGTSDQLSFSGIGGKKPDESYLRVVGGAFAVEGQFGKGEDVIVELKLRTSEVAFADKVDPKTAQATSCRRNHKGRVIGAVVVRQDTIARLDDLTREVQGYLAGDVSRETLEALVGGE